ncbi:MAG: penicillin-binding protein 1B [Candidatus Polarisedimenticolaceae bacterium]|nr:penicillin-binding protein 1B [Candidatus Polarisedimenticolaceae bacterium]
MVKGRKRKKTKAGGLLISIKLTIRTLLFLLLFGALLGTLFYGIYLDQRVKAKFAGKRWALPAQVFSRSLELYVGARLGSDDLLAELKRLGYRRSKHPNTPGSYSYYKNRFLIRTRSFHFWDKKEPSHYFEIKIANQLVTTLKGAAAGDAISLLRLEPSRIGSIYPAHNEDRILVKHEELPELLIEALIAVEDRSFYSHFGVDPKAILRALWVNIRAGGIVQGGSTLTQQLVKNFLLSPERTLVRKLNEAIMALMVDAHYSKEEILEAYSNEIYLGQDGGRAIHGFGLASQFYFNRPLAELDLTRIAMLVGMIRGPSYYDPRRDSRRATKRRNLVIDVMLKQGLINRQQADAATRSKLAVEVGSNRANKRYPAFIDLVRRQLLRDYREEDLNSEGLRIYTTLDPLVQRHTERGLVSRLDKIETARGKELNSLQAAAVVARVESGEVLAVVGGRKPGFAGFNRALDAIRPIGSLVKPAVYLAALQEANRYNLLTPLKDAPVTLKGADGTLWRPKNFDGITHGDVPLSTALAESHNLATVNLGLDIGVRKVIKTLKAAGIRRKIAPYPSLFLGALSLSPLEVTQLYQTLAAGGFKAPLRAIHMVADANGKPLSRYSLNVEIATDPGATYLLNRALQEVVRSGTGKSLNTLLSRELNVAGKTGTTDDYRDSWFAGFTGTHVAVVWVGQDNNQPTGLTGATGALQVWGEIINRLSSAPFEPLMPDNVDLFRLDRNDHLLADESCDEVIEVPFIRGSEPSQASACQSVVERFFRRFF